MPTQPQKIDVYSARAQCMHMLLAVLSDMRGIRAKQEVLAYIQSHHFFDLQPEDWEPYPSQTEPRWHTMIAWARKECVIRDMMFNHDEIDHWEITRHGLEVFQKFTRRYQRGDLDVRRCFLWTSIFKRLMNADYEPSCLDSPRPPNLDTLLQLYV